MPSIWDEILRILREAFPKAKKKKCEDTATKICNWLKQWNFR